MSRRQRLASARLYLVCDEQPQELIEGALRGGADIVQLRIKDRSDEEIVRVARRYSAACAAHGALFILNDRADLAVATDADGVHVGQDDMPVNEARGIVGGERIVGLSTHTEAQIEAAGAMPVDYIGVGPVYETPTKPGRRAVGLELVRFAATRARAPFFAIGGITTANVERVRSVGAERVAVVRALTEASDPEQVAGELRAALMPVRPGAGVGIAGATGAEIAGATGAGIAGATGAGIAGA